SAHCDSVLLALARPQSLLQEIRALQIDGGAGPYAQDREQAEIGPKHRHRKRPGSPEQHRRHGGEIGGQQAEPEGKVSEVGHRTPLRYEVGKRRVSSTYLRWHCGAFRPLRLRSL